MISLPIEVRASRHRPLGMTPAKFLRDYWQKKPLLIRGAFDAAHATWIAPNDLAGLACEAMALSRIVRRDAKRDTWKLINGPFAEKYFAQLGDKNWTLLAQDVDKWDGDVAAILNSFEFVPSWRIDDVMISYATDGGGVGPHVDQYDVFLIQGIGRRRWRIDTNQRADKSFRDDVELKILRHFAPSHDWLLESGDMLYLPPGIPHEGTAVGECMTYSVGMRAPSRAELLLDFAEFIAEPLGDDARYVDPDLAPAHDDNEITAASLARVRAAMPAFAKADDAMLGTWFGRFITRYRSAHEAAPIDRPMSLEKFRAKLKSHRVSRNPWSRMAWIRHGKAALLFVAGDSFPCSVAVAKQIAANRELSTDELLKSPRSLPLFLDLVNRGHWTLFR